MDTTAAGSYISGMKGENIYIIENQDWRLTDNTSTKTKKKKRLYKEKKRVQEL